MRFYQQPHGFYCGVDLHARSMYLCILDAAGQTVLHRDYPAEREVYLHDEPEDLRDCCPRVEPRHN